MEWSGEWGVAKGPSNDADYYAELLLQIAEPANCTSFPPLSDLQKSVNKVLLFFEKVSREFEVALGDALEHFHLRPRLKGRTTAAHFVRQNAHSPPVHCVPVACHKIRGENRSIDQLGSRVT